MPRPMLLAMGALHTGQAVGGDDNTGKAPPEARRAFTPIALSPKGGPGHQHGGRQCNQNGPFQFRFF